SPESPIVLLEAIAPPFLETVAPGNPYLGVMLPYTPLHHLLMVELNFPVVATSGNLSGEPICIDEGEALARLGEIADLFLVHNRAIARPIDDSVVRIICGREMVLRRARGYAPLPIYVGKNATNYNSEKSVLAVGGHLKNTVAASVQNQIFLSQHIGDLETTAAFECFQQIITSFQKLYEFEPQIVACDVHPNYLSSKFARDLNLPVIVVQHHYAHILACMAENQLEPPVLGIAWDGTGYGLDGTIWGGEFLLINETYFERFARFRPFKLPGGDKAVKEPRRVALGLLYELFGDEVFSLTNLPPVAAFADKELSVIKTMLEKNINSPTTSSAGRLFDAVSALIGIKQVISFEGQGAMELEFAVEKNEDKYGFEIVSKNSLFDVDWEPMVLEIIEDKKRGVEGAIAAKFHNTLVAIIVEVAKMVGREKVVLSGGCFQNKYLTEKTVEVLQRENFRPYWHQRVPPNDGGIALGQVLAAIQQQS
ncbi:MAG: carbamoyltransferase HypF, partial [Okeania sp. SIO2H7]|nr:carbamoyltransferase HypF [Okeania sp. SIO2H7]